MTVRQVIEHLNRNRGYRLASDHYIRVSEWKAWWRGYHKPFHRFKERRGDRVRERDMYSLKMAKKVCEDWASILLNEKTLINIDDKASQAFVSGDDLTGGVLGENDFWEQGNLLVEKAFSTGTGAFVVGVSGATVQGDRVTEGSVTIDYLDAGHIIPLTIKGNRITECAFASDVMIQGRHMVYLQIHELTPKGYRITNQVFSNDRGRLKDAPLPEGLAATIETGSNIPLFAIVYPNIANTFKNAHGMGMSVFAGSIDNLKGVDLAYNNFNRDFVLGGKKVFYNDSLIQVGKDGLAITPDDVMQQLFVQVAEAHMAETGSNTLVHEFNPSLRVGENVDGIQAQLDYLSFKCGLGTKHYQFNSGSIVTATQYTGDKQELIQNASKHYIVMERALQDLCRAILWAGREVLGQPVNPDANISITFDDSFVIDKESERLRDLQEVRDGLMQKWEYRVKWRGENEATAKKMVPSEKTDDSWMGFE